ncbi:MAG: phosphonopyruvate decarboxylase [Bacilli bacterium]|nr:phosphonopyruvate decarboxylase [Bacilli bacterium]
MINTKEFYDYLLSKKFDFFAGVPDSLLKNLCACIKENSDKKHNIITANEGNAVALASGYHIASGNYGVVYMQNSGIGNTVNPLLSLVDEEVYSIPMLLIVGWRGEPGVKDEPQHVKQGKVTIELFETMGIECVILDENYKEKINYCYDYISKNNKPIALIVRKGSFDEYKTSKPINNYTITREEALETIIDNLNNDDFIVSTTGKTSREIFEIRERRNEEHSNDFLTVGSMGHTSSIALGMSIGSDKDIYCIDGDGSFIMHTGAFAVIPSVAEKNFKYILINNGAHESVGGQPTVGFDIDVEKLLLSFGFKNVYKATTTEEIEKYMNNLKENELQALVIYTKLGSRDDLGRPTVSPINNKKAMMKKFED